MFIFFRFINLRVFDNRIWKIQIILENMGKKWIYRLNNLKIWKIRFFFEVRGFYYLCQKLSVESYVYVIVKFGYDKVIVKVLSSRYGENKCSKSI